MARLRVDPAEQQQPRTPAPPAPGHDEADKAFEWSPTDHGPAWELLKVRRQCQCCCGSSAWVMHCKPRRISVVPLLRVRVLLILPSLVWCGVVWCGAQGLDQSLPPQWWWQRGWSEDDVKAVTAAVNEALKKAAEVPRQLTSLPLSSYPLLLDLCIKIETYHFVRVIALEPLTFCSQNRRTLALAPLWGHLSYCPIAVGFWPRPPRAPVLFAN